jgi:hypothetical protein
MFVNVNPIPSMFPLSTSQVKYKRPFVASDLKLMAMGMVTNFLNNNYYFAKRCCWNSKRFISEVDFKMLKMFHNMIFYSPRTIFDYNKKWIGSHETYH